MMKYLKLLLAVSVIFSCQKEREIIPSSTNDYSYNEGVINDEIGGVPIVIYANSERNFFCAFQRKDINGVVYEFEQIGNTFPNVFKTKNGDIWNIYGEKKNGHSTNRLLSVNSLVGYWFIFPTFHKKIVLQSGVEVDNPEFNAQNQMDEWLIDLDFLFAGSIKNGIRSIDDPIYIGATSKEFIDNEFYKALDPEELLTVVKVGNVVHLYPHRILEYHEVVNDVIGDQPIVVSFCPLTGTSRAWSREFNEQIFEFGVSGLLYNNNLVLYDRNTDSNWSQILNKSVNGDMIGTSVSSLNVLEIEAQDMINVEGRIKLLSTETGIQYDYQFPVYGDYKESDRISFPLKFSDTTIPIKERVIGVTINNITNVYRFSDFERP